MGGKYMSVNNYSKNKVLIIVEMIIYALILVWFLKVFLPVGLM